MPGAVQSILIAAALASPVWAWTPETRVRMTDEAVRLMPASLRLALESHREPLLRGMLAAMVEEDGPEHLPPWSGGRMAAALESETQGLVGSLVQPMQFTEVARRFGAVAHFVADAGFPPGASERDGARRYAHFAAFCESRRGRFPFVYYGAKDPELDQASWGEFALKVLHRASADDRELARAYLVAGEPPDPAAFDDRSVPFAVGSLAYSRSINDIVQVWLAAWRQAGGDMGRTPYLKIAVVQPEGKP